LVINVNLPWSAGEWTHPPISAVEHGDDLLVTATEGSDAWRKTNYGFIHDSEHALVATFRSDSAMEVEFTAINRRGGSEIRGHGPRYLVAGVDQRYRGPTVERAAGMADSE
jgi:hypothetical protein